MAKSNTARAIPEPPVMPWPSLSDEWRAYRDEYIEEEAAFKRVVAAAEEAKQDFDKASKAWQAISEQLNAALSRGERSDKPHEGERNARQLRDEAHQNHKRHAEALEQATKAIGAQRSAFSRMKAQELARCHQTLEQTLGREVRDAVRRYVLHVRAFHGVYRPMDYNWWRRTFLGWTVDEETRQYHALERAVDRYLMED